jgi:hypothetical protein
MITTSGIMLFLMMAPPSGVPVLVAKSRIEAGTVISVTHCEAKEWPANLYTSSLLRPDSLLYVVNQRTLETLEPGDPIMWSQFASSFFGGGRLGLLCQIEIPKRARQPKAMNEPYAYFAQHDMEVGERVSARDFERRRVDPAVLTRLVVRLSSLSELEGDRILAPNQKGDMLRYPQLASFASSERCEWLKEDLCNVHGDGPPLEAGAFQCPQGTRLLSGVPPKWTPHLPGWVVACADSNGQFQGPYVAWSRLSDQKLFEGSFERGRASGTWKRWNERGGLRWERIYIDGHRLDAPMEPVDYLTSEVMKPAVPEWPSAASKQLALLCKSSVVARPFEAPHESSTRHVPPTTGAKMHVVPQ